MAKVGNQEEGDSFVCYDSFRVSINRFKGTPLFEKAFNALFDYGCFGKPPDENDDISILVFMDQIIPVIKAAKERREKTSIVRSEAGKKGGEAKSKAMMGNQNAKKNGRIDVKQNKTEQTEQNRTNRTKQNVDVYVDVDDDVDASEYVDVDKTEPQLLDKDEKFNKFYENFINASLPTIRKKIKEECGFYDDTEEYKYIELLLRTQDLYDTMKKFNIKDISLFIRKIIDISNTSYNGRIRPIHSFKFLYDHLSIFLFRINNEYRH